MTWAKDDIKLERVRSRMKEQGISALVVRAPPLADGQPGEAEQPVTGLLEAVGHRLAFEPPFAEEGPSARLNFRS